MCVICDGTMTLEESWADMLEKILRFGFAIQGVEGTDRYPSFAYTVGLSRRDHPEVIAFAMHSECAARALVPVAAAVLAGRRFDDGDDPSDLYPYDEPAALLRFPDSSTHLYAANTLYRRPGQPPIPALELCWPSVEPAIGSEDEDLDACPAPLQSTPPADAIAPTSIAVQPKGHSSGRRRVAGRGGGGRRRARGKKRAKARRRRQRTSG